MKQHPLRNWREVNDFTQDKAARKLGVTVSCWRNWEAGRSIPQPSHMRKIVKECGIRPDAIYAAAS